MTHPLSLPALPGHLPARLQPGLPVDVQLAVLAVVAVVVAVAALFVWVMWRRGLRLRAGAETLRQYWRGLEKALVDHHQAAEDLVRVADATGALRRREREQVESAVASATLTGTPAQRARREHVLHEAAAELVQALRGRPAARTAEVEQAGRAYDSAWEQVEMLGQRYTGLVAGFNRLVNRPVLRVWNRRLGWGAAEPFEAREPAGMTPTVDVL